jgi:ribonuclease VapC
MVVDSSAIVAILMQEPEARAFAEAIARDPIRLMSTVSLLETSMVIESRFGPSGGREVDLLLHRSSLEVVPVTAEQCELARVAWRRFGKGRHAAALNLGDCCSYALAEISGEPILAKGNDFARTDARLAPLSPT